jgi:hypothetical protein
MTETYASQQRGPVGNTRSIGLSILWAVLTLGIYTLVWTYKTQEEVKRYSSPVRGVTGLWFILPLIGNIVWFVKVQGALNRYWESKGAPPP